MTTADRLDAILTELRTTNLLLSAMAAAHDRDHLQAAQVRWQLGDDGGIAEIQHFASQRGPGGRCDGCVSVSRPHDDGGNWLHLGCLEDRVTEVSGPTYDTPGVA